MMCESTIDIIGVIVMVFGRRKSDCESPLAVQKALATVNTDNIAQDVQNHLFTGP